MKIATYNIWNSDIGIRTDQLIETINNTDADFIGLQEVTPVFFETLVANTNYPHHVYSAPETTENENDFVAILSKHPICKHYTLVESAEYGDINAHSAIIEVDGIRISFTNVHLPWDSALTKEQQIVAIQKFIRTQKDNAHFFVLAGDFNCSANSSVHHFLLGDMSLQNYEANPYWNDLSGIHAALNDCKVAPTLDFINNPRWSGKKPTWAPTAVDRIYLMECMEGPSWDYEWDIKNVTVFGKDVSPKTGLAPSDHYGVLVDIMFKI